MLSTPRASEDDSMSATTRYAAMSRRAAITAAALTAMVAMSGCGPKTAGSAAGDMAMGAPEASAKVTVVEYASVTCPHCAAWQENTWEAFKAAYVDTNKVRYVFRELPTPPAPVAVAGFALARCAGADKYFQVVHELMADQRTFVGDPRTTLMRVGNAVGLNEQQVQACITDEASLKAADDRAEAARNAGVTTTPAFFVNGTQVITPGGEGPSMEDLSKAIDAELAKG
jgi:protein-disulfide isomerase